MTQVIDFEGEKHEFPDDAKPDEIRAALMHYEPQKKQTGLLESAVKPITDIPSTYTGMVNDAVSQMGHGAEQIGHGDVLKGAGNMGLGALNYVTSPINAPMHTIVGDPVHNATGSETAGNIAELGASLLLPIPKGIPRFGAGATKAAEIPTTEALYASATKGFEHPEVSNVAIKPSALQQWSQKLKSELTEEGADDVNAKRVWKLLDKLERPDPNSFVSGKNLKSLRESLSGLATPEPATAIKTRNPMAATMAIHSLDDFIGGGIPQSSIIRGDPAKVQAIWNTARGDFAAAKRSDAISGALENANLQAGSAHSGQNIDNATRQQIKAILKNPRLRRGYSNDELAQMRRVVVGTFTGDKARFIANLTGKGGGLGAAFAGVEGARLGYDTGGAIGAIVGGATPAIGYAFGKLSNAITANEISKLQTLIRSRSPLAEQMRGPMQDWSKASIAFTGSSTPRNVARLLVASRNLANNLKDAGITVSADNLIRSLQGPTASEAGPSDKSDKQQ